MASAFEKLARVSRSLVDRVHGERIRLSFMAAGVADPARPQMEIRACLYVEEQMPVSIGDAASPNRAPIVAATATLYIERSTYAGPDLRVDDKIRALDRPGEPVWRVSKPIGRDAGQIIATLSEVAK